MSFRQTQHKNVEDEWRREWAATQNGIHLKRIDESLPLNEPCAYMARLHDIKLISWRNYGLATPGSQRMDGVEASPVTTDAYVEQRKRWRMWWWTAQGCGQQDNNYGTR